MLPHRSKVALLVTLVTLITIGLCAWRFVREMRPPNLGLPADSDIERMSATINDLEGSMGISPIPPFAIPTEYYPVILGALTPLEKHGAPGSSGLTMGQVEVFTKSGRKTTIIFFACGKNPLCFSIDGHHYIRGGEYRPIFINGSYEGYIDESMLFYHILRAIHEETVAGLPSDNLERYVEDLRRSKGGL